MVSDFRRSPFSIPLLILTLTTTFSCLVLPVVPAKANAYLAENTALDLRTSRPNGIDMKLTGVAIADDHIAVDLEVTNGSG
ncbi:MAG: hypothetical protein MUF49_12310 [Oculatellaceae cyanobacterium Prado106]|jgi:hypothetical protein|nr:hypothetical protein [Oculatellaceae cyanobacterium Prado106]